MTNILLMDACGGKEKVTAVIGSGTGGFQIVTPGWSLVTESGDAERDDGRELSGPNRRPMSPT